MKPKDLVDLLLSMLPREPRSYDTADNPGFWTDGEQILCPSEAECEIVATFLQDVFSEYPEMPLIRTGWYDPFEDSANGEQDDYTGFNYIQFE